MTKLKELKERLSKEIEKTKFTSFEVKGFEQKPKLALMAGACLGYKLAIKDIESKQVKETKLHKFASSCNEMDFKRIAALHENAIKRFNFHKAQERDTDIQAMETVMCKIIQYRILLDIAERRKGSIINKG